MQKEIQAAWSSRVPGCLDCRPLAIFDKWELGYSRKTSPELASMIWNLRPFELGVKFTLKGEAIWENISSSSSVLAFKSSSLAASTSFLTDSTAEEDLELPVEAKLTTTASAGGG